jgi:membrane protease YdiL (CAAX protease family)
MEAARRVWSKIMVFLLLAFAISSLSYYDMIRTGSAGDVVVFWMWSPGIAAILTLWLFRGSVRDLGWHLGEAKYLLLGYGIPLLYASVIYGTAWVTGLGGFHMSSIRLAGLRLPFAISLPVSAVLGIIPACVAALGEEMGWRGLLIPELAKITTFARASLVSGVIWAVWHYPAIMFADYNSDAPLWFDLATVTIAVHGMSLFTAWLRLRTGSIWPGVLWHGSHNLFIQTVFLGLTRDTGVTEYIVDDFGVGVLLASLILGYVSWRKRSELPEVIRCGGSCRPISVGGSGGEC